MRPEPERLRRVGKAAKLKKLGRAVAPVDVEDRKIAHSFWGKA